MNKKNKNAPDSLLRRKTIKTLAAGVGVLAGSSVLPDKWVTPVIQGIALPAHAQTSAPGVAFCSERHELTLVDGHSGTSEMTIEASGCIMLAQGNVDLEMTLEGYDTPAITRNDHDKGSGDGSLFAAVSDALVPSAHAAPAPKCTVKVKVKTDADGNYKVTFKLNCGKGIIQVVMHGARNGAQTRNLGWLDIPACNPCMAEGGTGTSCDARVLAETSVSGLQFRIGANGNPSQNVTITAADIGQHLYAIKDSGITLDLTRTFTFCDSTKDPNVRNVTFRSWKTEHDIGEITAQKIEDFDSILITERASKGFVATVDDMGPRSIDNARSLDIFKES